MPFGNILKFGLETYKELQAQQPKPPAGATGIKTLDDITPETARTRTVKPTSAWKPPTPAWEQPTPALPPPPDKKAKPDPNDAGRMMMHSGLPVLEDMGKAARDFNLRKKKP